MFKHDFVYSIIEEFVEIDNKTKKLLNNIELKKDNENYNNFYNNNENILMKIILDKLGFIFKKYKLTLNHCWLQLYKRNDYHSLHAHFNTKKDYSFVWFIEGDKKSSPLKFYDVGFPIINCGNVKTIEFIPGKLLIFPGFLPHEVPLNKTNKRLIVSGNVI
jgi:CHAT domain-containing protein|tara:strand:- start:66 stop:548 length:483 start_codon:yes stop_codon:yes gene_type:complete